MSFGWIGPRFSLLALLNLALWAGLSGAALLACSSPVEPDWRWSRAEAGLPRQVVALAVALDPENPARLWAGTYTPGGLVRSEDGGQTWLTETTGLGDNPVFDLLFVPGSGVLWAGVRDGLLQSPDGGATWQRVEGLPAAAIFSLAADASGRVYAGLDDGGIYAQETDGVSWVSLVKPASPLASQSPQLTDEVPPLAQAAVLALAVSPDGQHLYAGTAGQGLFASRDGGRTWSAAFPGVYAPNVALDPTQPGLALASLRDRLVRTRDGGRSWQEVPVAWAGDEVVSLLWLADGTLGAGTGRGALYRSLDGGESWVEGRAGLPNSGGILDLAAGRPAHGGPALVLAGTWTGLYGSHDGGQTWRNLAPSLGAPHAYTLLSGSTGLFLGTRAGLFRWQPEVSRWQPVAADFPPGGISALAAAPSDGDILYAGAAGGGLYRSEDGGGTWQRTRALGVGIPAITVDPADAGHLYILAAWERAYESRDGGQTWQARWEGLGETIEAVSIGVDPSEPETVYLGAEAGLYRSRSSQPWEPVAPDLAQQTVLVILPRLIPGPTATGTVLYLGATAGIYRSLNGGITTTGSMDRGGWGRGLESVSVTALLANPADPRQLYAGTAYAGLYQSLDWGETWQAIGPAGLQEDTVTGLGWGPEGDLFVAAGRGVWVGVRQ